MHKLIQEALVNKRETLLRKREVLRITGLSNSSLYVYIKRGLIKPGVPVGPRIRGWPETEINSFVAACIAARDQKNGGVV